MKMGDKLMTEEQGPRALLDNAKAAEGARFDFVSWLKSWERAPFALALSLCLVAGVAQAQEANCTPTVADRAKIGRIDDAWRAALADARVTDRAKLEALGALVERGAGQVGRPQPSPGLYRCRTVKLGAAGRGMPALTAYGYFRCRVQLSPGGNLTLTKLTGSQRQVGAVCPAEREMDTRRTLFLGGMGLGGSPAPAYGAGADTDVAGVIERIGPQRWRMITPWPAFESKLDILELVKG